jgi:hypothetical protein
MEKVQKPSNSLCYTPSSEHFKALGSLLLFGFFDLFYFVLLGIHVFGITLVSHLKRKAK